MPLTRFGMATAWLRVDILMVFNPAEFRVTVLFTIFGTPRMVRAPIV